MRREKLITIGVSLSFIVVLFASFIPTFSWFNTTIEFNGGIKGESAGAYFAGGEGTKENPYILTNRRHFYNLSWLQYLGYFNETTTSDSTETIKKQYYFKVNNDINCEGLALPPIGTTKYPFIGSFDGGNYTISNFTITDTYEKLVSHPHVIEEDGNDYYSSGSATINYCSIVGTFGVIGSYSNVPSATYDTSIPSLSNLYLDDVTIATKTDNVLVGCFAGYVNSTIDNCGVHYAKFDIEANTTKLTSFNNVSEFTLIGSYNKDKYKWDGDSESGDIGYGTSTDIKALHLSLINNELSDGTTGQIKSKVVLPFKYENATLIEGSGTQINVSIYVNTSGTYTKKSLTPSSTYKASTKGNNLGYYIGEVKTYEKSLDYNINDFGVQQGYTNVYLTTPPDDVLSYLKTNGTHLIRLNNGYASDNISQSTFSYVENGQVGDYFGDLLLPSNGIWVAPKEDGKFKFVFYNESYSKKGSVGILFLDLTRETSGDYSSPFMYNALVGSGLSYSCKYGYFEKAAYVGHEYYITFYNTSSYDAPYIAYMDIGINGSSTPSDDRLSLANFDFVTKVGDSLTKIKTYDETTSSYVSNDNYSSSNVTFIIGDTTTDTIVAFRRLVNESIGVYYYDSSSSILTPSSTGNKTSTKKEDCTSSD